MRVSSTSLAVFLLTISHVHHVHVADSFVFPFQNKRSTVSTLKNNGSTNQTTLLAKKTDKTNDKVTIGNISSDESLFDEIYNLTNAFEGIQMQKAALKKEIAAYTAQRMALQDSVDFQNNVVLNTIDQEITRLSAALNKVGVSDSSEKDATAVAAKAGSTLQKELEDKVAVAQEQIAFLSKKIQEKERDIENYASVEAKLTTDYATLKQELKDAEVALGSRDKIISALEKSNEQQSEEVRVLSESLVSALADSEMEVEKIKAMWEKEKAELEEVKNRLESELNSALSNIKQAEAKALQTEEAAKIVIKEQQEQTRQFEYKLKQLVNAEKKILKQEMYDLETKLQNTKYNFYSADMKRKVLESTLEKFEEKLALLEKTHEQEITDLTERLNVAETFYAKNKDLKSRAVRIVEKFQARLKRRESKAKNEIEELRSSYETQVSELKRKIAMDQTLTGELPSSETKAMDRGTVVTIDQKQSRTNQLPWFASVVIEKSETKTVHDKPSAPKTDKISKLVEDAETLVADVANLLKKSPVLSPTKTKPIQVQQLDDKAKRQEEQQKKKEAVRIAEEARLAEEKRLADQMKRQEEEKKKKEAARIAEEAQLAEEMKRQEEEKKKEAARIVEEARLAEEKRLADQMKRQEEEQKKKEAARMAKEEELRLIEEKEAARVEKARLAEEARLAEQNRLLEEAEKDRLEFEARIAEEKRIRQEEAEQMRLAEEARVAAEMKRREEEEERIRTAELAAIEEEKRQEAEKREKARLEEEARLAEKARLKAEREEQARIEEEARIAEENRIEMEKQIEFLQEQERLAEIERLKAEEEKAFRIAEEARIAEEQRMKAEEARLVEAERIKAEEEKRLRLEEEARVAEQEKLLQQKEEELRLAEEARLAEQERLKQLYIEQKLEEKRLKEEESSRLNEWAMGAKGQTVEETNIEIEEDTYNAPVKPDPEDLAYRLYLEWENASKKQEEKSESIIYVDSLDDTVPLEDTQGFAEDEKQAEMTALEEKRLAEEENRRVKIQADLAAAVAAEKQQRSLLAARLKLQPTEIQSSVGADKNPAFVQINSIPELRIESDSIAISDQFDESEEISSVGGDVEDVDMTDSIIAQRYLYRYSPTEGDVRSAFTIEDRQYFKVNEDKNLVPMGSKSFILRSVGENDSIEDFSLGPALVAINGLKDDSTLDEKSRVLSWQSAYASALYVFANPKIISGRGLEVSSGTGLAGIMSVLGLGYASPNSSEAEFGDEGEFYSMAPKRLSKLLMTDAKEDNILKCIDNLKTSLFPVSKVDLGLLDIKDPLPRNMRNKFDFILGNDCADDAESLAKAFSFAIQEGPNNIFLHVTSKEKEQKKLKLALDSRLRMFSKIEEVVMEKLNLTPLVFDTIKEATNEMRNVDSSPTFDDVKVEDVESLSFSILSGYQDVPEFVDNDTW